MIGKLTGKIISLNEDNLILDINGVGYLVYMSVLGINKLSINTDVSLFIETYVREDNITLFGFITDVDKVLFNLLKSVQGVGPKLALTIMSLESEVLLNALTLQDSKKLQTIAGVGAKVAARIINELHDKVNKFFNKSNLGLLKEKSENKISKGIVNEAVSALKSLGYSDKEAEKAINYVLKCNSDSNISIEEIVKQALSYFSHT